MPIAHVLALAFMLTGSAALAQGACVPRETPDLAAAVSAPVLFQHCVEEGKCGAVDKTGAWKVAPVHRDVIIHEDFIVVPENEEWSKFGFLDSDGKRLGGGDYSINIEEQLPASEGMLPVIANEKMGYVDRTGALVVPADLDEAYAFQGGLAAVVKGDARYFIDKSGIKVLDVPVGIDDVNSFDGDVAIVGKEQKYGLLSRTGQIVVEPKFSAIYTEGSVLIASLDEGYGIIDQTGAWIVEPKFDSIGAFSRGLAPAEQKEAWGFIDTCGNWKIEPKYGYVAGFEGGPARVKIAEKWGLIDETGKEIHPLTALYIGEGFWTDGRVTFTADDKQYGLLDTSGKIALEPKFDSVEPLGGGVLLSYTGEEEKLLDLGGNEIAIAPAP